MILRPGRDASKPSGDHGQDLASKRQGWFAAGGLQHGLRRAWPLWLVLMSCIGLQLGGPSVRQLLRYDRRAVASGQWWRLFTGNFVHASWVHLGLDLGGVVLLWILTGNVLRGWRWVAATVIGAWGIGLGLWWAWPQLVWYVGISGVVHTYWAAGAILLAAGGFWEGWALLIFLAGKLTWEQATGTPLPSTTEILHEPVVTSAHLVGAITGVLLAGLLLWEREWARRRAGDHRMRTSSAPDVDD